jgi:hypothetical protein
MHRIATVVALAALVAGCAHRPQTATFVRQVTIEGKELVIERCRVSATGDVFLVGRCATRRVPLPVVVQRRMVRVAPLRGVERRVERASAEHPAERPALAAAISPSVRDALMRCGARSHAGESVRLRLVVDRAGALSAVEPDVSDPDLVACAGEALAAVRFPPSADGGTLTLHFRTGREGP